MGRSENETITAGDALGAALLRALAGDPRFASVGEDDLASLPGGVTHRHLAIAGVAVDGRALIARIPLLSQWGLAPADALAYEAACFERAEPSARTPRLAATLPPGPSLEHGALIVERIEGAKPRLPRDLPAIADTLAALHLLPVPPPSRRPPLQVHADPVAATLSVIEEQAQYLGAASRHALIDGEAARLVAGAIATVRGEADRWRDLPPALTFCGTDTHPGNFLMRAGPTGRKAAVFVDLEKAMYGCPAIDLAHATLYTSTMWDADVATSLTAPDVAAFHERYFSRIPTALADTIRPWLLPARQLTWLRTTTWAVRWLVLSREAGSPWGGAHISETAQAHMAKTVADYLSPATLARLGRELGAD